MGFILVVTLLVLGLGIGAALLPFVAFRSKLTRPFGRVAKAKWRRPRLRRSHALTDEPPVGQRATTPS